MRLIILLVALVVGGQARADQSEPDAGEAAGCETVKLQRRIVELEKRLRAVQRELARREANDRQFIREMNKVFAPKAGK